MAQCAAELDDVFAALADPTRRAVLCQLGQGPAGVSELTALNGSSRLRWSSPVNPDLDLTLQRVIRAPRARVWHAWTDPAALEHWWIPAPAMCRVDRLEPRAGGAFVTSISEDGTG